MSRSSLLSAHGKSVENKNYVFFVEDSQYCILLLKTNKSLYAFYIWTQFFTLTSNPYYFRCVRELRIRKLSSLIKIKKALLFHIVTLLHQAEWSAKFDGTDACVTPVLDQTQATQHPHNVAR
jgi:hypothetical protein